MRADDAGAAGDGLKFRAYAEGFRALKQLVAAQALAGQAQVAGGGGIPKANHAVQGSGGEASAIRAKGDGMN